MCLELHTSDHFNNSEGKHNEEGAEKMYEPDGLMSLCTLTSDHFS